MSRTKSAVHCTAIRENPFNTNVLNAEVRQTVTSIYSPTTNKASIFAESEFGEESIREFDSERVAFFPVPLQTKEGKAMDIEAVNERLKKYPNASIQRVLTNNPQDILTENDENAIKAGLRTFDDFASKYLIRDQQGNLIQRNGKLQYGRNFFQVSHIEDLDFREQTIVRSDKVSNIPKLDMEKAAHANSIATTRQEIGQPIAPIVSGGVPEFTLDEKVVHDTSKEAV